jgi:hypothetical protein
MSLLSVSADAKTVKGEKKGYLTGILYLAPATLAGVGNLCPDSTAGCREACLYSAGRGAFNSVQEARIAKTKRFKADRAGFMAELVKDIAALVRKAKRAGLIPVVRLNGTSDLPWENIAVHSAMPDREHRSLMTMFPDVQFYDYTKSFRRMGLMVSGKLPANYHLTFSRSECNDASAQDVLRAGGNVAVVFSTRKGEALPTRWQGFEAINGDESDLRFLDYSPVFQAQPRPKTALGFKPAHYGLVVGLRSKGRARKDASGFVVTA